MVSNNAISVGFISSGHIHNPAISPLKNFNDHSEQSNQHNNFTDPLVRGAFMSAEASSSILIKYGILSRQAPKTSFFAGNAGIMPASFNKMRASRPRSQGFSEVASRQAPESLPLVFLTNPQPEALPEVVATSGPPLKGWEAHFFLKYQNPVMLY